MDHIPWWAWTVVAGALGLAELNFPGSYLIWIALGAAATAAIDAIWGLSFERELVTFAIASAISCFIGFFVYRRLFHRAADSGAREADTTLNRRDRAMVGARGVVSAALVNGRGKVRLGDGVWQAQGPNLPEGAHIVVTDTRDTWLVVEPSEGQ